VDLAGPLAWVIPIIFSLWQFLLAGAAGRQGLGSLLPIGESRAKVYIETDVNAIFDDVAGVDEAKEELRVVSLLKTPTAHTFTRTGFLPALAGSGMAEPYLDHRGAARCFAAIKAAR
jgi:ATP-dependent Zn protease